ncbi:hypothetical protein DHEL01_v201328 [Diaporthe helianthi]|uniref:Extracellular membrane protein CFEM domain-containing protein n=1 Tax=Diaporthe helianthi TaxID=158607 RepID=A0A2P5ICT2_DIAHE|nr:hypothetical protein DHEL01_v201328 [Diaporthe helianthi]
MAAGRARLLLWATSIPLIGVRATETASTSATTGLDLGSDITAFIPSCARACVESFIEVNFEPDLCGSSPSLQCLCSRTGSTGYTLGEGAVQCIVAENSIRACEGMSAGSDTVANAYAMCNNQPSAVPATHATIIATLIVPPTGPVVVPNPSPTASRSSNKSSTTSYMTPSVTMEPSLSTRPVSSSSWTFLTRTSSSFSVSSSAASSATTAPQSSETGAAAAPTGLSTAQIGGIAGGTVGAVLIAGILAVWCFTRRRRGKAVTGFYRVRDSWSPRKKDSPEISAPQYREPKSMSFTRALAQRANRASARPDTIGLAISPEGAGMQGTAGQPGGNVVAATVPPAAHLAQKRSPQPPPIPALSPLRTQGNFNFFSPQGQSTTQQQDQQASAAKPALTVAIPPARPQPANRSSTNSNNRMPFGGGRDSVVTEFAEDGETSAGLGSAQIWRPPNTDPQSASTYYIADKWGNWVLGGGSGPEDHIVEMPTPISKTVAERDAEQDRAVQESSAVRAAVKDLSSPTLGGPVAVGISKPAGGPGRPTIRHVAPESGRLPINTRSSSVYSNFNTNFSMPQTVQPGPNNPLPNSAGSRKESSPNPESYYAGSGAVGRQQGRDLTSSRHRRGSSSAGGATRDRTNTMMSQDSATTIASSIGSEVGVDSFPAPSRRQSAAAPEQQGSLSPVVESPGRSPVSYPKIPRPRSNAPLNRPAGGPAAAMKPLQHPALRVVNSMPNDSPTLGVVDSQKPVQLGGPQAPATTTPAQSRVSYYNPPRRNPNPNRNPGQVRSGSPETPPGQPIPRPLALPSNRRDTNKSPPLQSFQQHINNRSQLPSQSHSRYGPMSVYDAYSRPESNMSSQQQQQLKQQQQQYFYQQLHQPSQEYHYQNDPGGPYSFSPSPSRSTSLASASQSPSVSNTTLRTADSQSSLLAAKRLGAERAAALQIGQGDSPEARQARWKRRTSSLGKTGGQQAVADDASAAGGAPRGMVYRQAGGGGGGGNSRQSDVPLPATPGWKPQLTPKRRGDDLFLSVK